MVIVFIIASVLLLPLAGLIFLRLFENELIRQTEAELIGQSVVLSAVMAEKVAARRTDDIPLGATVDKSHHFTTKEGTFDPILPTLDLARENVIKPPRPDPREARNDLHPAFLQIGEELSHIASDTRKSTLAGFRILDPFGTTIAGYDSLGQSFAHVEEVAQALQGHYASRFRTRLRETPPPPIYAISRGTGVRIFVAMPVIVDGQVAGVIYASRTPRNIFRYFYKHKRTLLTASLLIITIVVILGYVFVRLITRPIYALIDRSKAIGQGDRSAIRPLKHRGTREIAALTQSFLTTAKGLFDRSDYISTFASHVSHELKSPLTAIQGAAELLRDSDASMSAKDRERFFRIIIDDSQRLSVLLQRLRELAKAENPQSQDSCNPLDALATIQSKFPNIQLTVSGNNEQTALISRDNAEIVFSHLIDNAVRHNASKLVFKASTIGAYLQINVQDNGDGISEHNRTKVFETFFTTRRESGGTGMGLCIVKSLLEANGGSIDFVDTDEGAAFQLRLPMVNG